jgi:hypothetical protein
VDAAVSGAIGLVAVPPVLVGTAYGIWKENQLDKQVWRGDRRAGRRANRSRPASSPQTCPACGAEDPRLPRHRDPRGPK